MFEGKPLQDKAIIITGGGTGLGKSMAIRFGELGADIVITGRREEKLKEACTEISKAGGKAIYFVGDVRNPEDVEKCVDGAYEQLGRLDGLVANAAGNFLSATQDISYSAFEKIIGIVLNGTFNYVQACGRKWIENETPGNIIAISTTYAWLGSGLVVPSACAKAGVLAMIRSLAVEWAKYNIRLNAIAPGPFPTEGAWDRLMIGGADELAKQKIPMKRFGKHPELTNLAAYLMTDFSDYMTGETITIDGGDQFTGGEFNEIAKMAKPQFDNIRQVFKKMKG